MLDLKLEHNREYRKLKLSKETHAKRVFEHFGITDYRPITCLVVPNVSLEVDKGIVLDFPYF